MEEEDERRRRAKHPHPSIAKCRRVRLMNALSSRRDGRRTVYRLIPSSSDARMKSTAHTEAMIIARSEVPSRAPARGREWRPDATDAAVNNESCCAGIGRLQCSCKLSARRTIF